tara:strand:+ start:2323 stop:2763 length:441 start_codon:yes stop_codon:yes gene_type:complete
MLKQGREINTKTSEYFRTSYGTVDVKSFKSLYLNLSSWVEPIHNLERWGEKINRIKYKIKSTVHNKIPQTPFKDKVIVDLDLRSSGIKKGKRSFMKCEVTLFLNQNKNNKDLKSIEIKNSVDLLTKEIIEKSLRTSKDFEFHPTKR